MMKLIATLGDISLYQTGYTTVYPDYEALTETFPAGHIMDAEGKDIPVPNILSVLRMQDWVIVADPDQPVGKGRKRKFSSRSEAGRYAARIRWGNQGDDASGPSSVPSNPLPVAATYDINEAILTGAPYAPFLPENFPPELKAALDAIPLEDKLLIFDGEPFQMDSFTATNNARAMLEEYYLGHLDPSKYSPETVDAMSKLTAHYTTLSPTGSPFGREAQAGGMADVMIKRVYENMYIEKMIGKPEALAYTQGMVASPSKRIAIAVQDNHLMKILDGGFTTQFETGQSGGSYVPTYRAAYEAVTFGVHPATIPTRRPIYANLHPVGVQGSRYNGSEQYGEIQMVVKQSVHARATFTVQDSLGSCRTPASVNGPIKVGQVSPTARKGGERRDPQHPADKPSKSANGQSYSYAEAQIQQGLKVSDIAYVTVPKGHRLSASVLARLRELGIPVKRTIGSEIIDDASVAKSIDSTIFLIMEAVEKAKKGKGKKDGKSGKGGKGGKGKSFGGDRSEAGRYAAHIRWGTTKGDPLYDADSTLTPEQAAIAAQSEAAVVEMFFPEGDAYDDQMMNALEAAGFVGEGPRPPAAPDYDQDVENNTVKYFAPDYHLLPLEMQTQEVIDKQHRILEARQKIVQDYYDGKGPRPYRDLEPDTEGSRAEDILGISLTWNAALSERELKRERSDLNGPDGKPLKVEITDKPQILTVYSNTGQSPRPFYIPSRQGIAKNDAEQAKVKGAASGKKTARDEAAKKIDAWLGVKVDKNAPKDKQGFDPRQARIAQVMGDLTGFHRGAQKVGADDFDALVKSGKFVVVFRGGSKAQIDSLSTTRPHIGGGEQGLGTYTAYSIGRASGYGETTPMLIPKSALTTDRAQGRSWGSPYGSAREYLQRTNVSHGEAENFETADLKVLNVSMLIVGPRGHNSGYGKGEYTEYVKKLIIERGVR